MMEAVADTDQAVLAKVALELAHLKEPNHTSEFRLLVERTLPDYGSRREWLARHGGCARNDRGRSQRTCWKENDHAQG